MAKHDVPANITYLVAIWLEALIYGFFMCLFCASVYVNLALRRSQDVHSRVMFGIGILLFIIASMHVSMNCYRMIQAYVVQRDGPGGPAGYINKLSPWDHVFKDTLYATQEILGDAVAIYRTWVVWGRDWRPVAIPCMLLVVSLVSGYSVCGLYPTEDPNSTVFDPRLLRWITIFYAISVVQSGLTTGLMAFRIWQTDRRSIQFRTNKEGNLLPIMRILIESASIQFVAEVILLSLYSANYLAQYLVLEPVTPLVGITFNAISVRIALRQSEVIQNASRSFGGAETTIPHANNAVATIGSIPMRPMNHTQSINIQIKKDVEAFGDGGSESEYLEYERKARQQNDDEIAHVQ